jgi:hypothetical protein
MGSGRETRTIRPERLIRGQGGMENNHLDSGDGPQILDGQYHCRGSFETSASRIDLSPPASRKLILLTDCSCRIALADWYRRLENWRCRESFANDRGASSIRRC